MKPVRCVAIASFFLLAASFPAAAEDVSEPPPAAQEPSPPAEEPSPPAEEQPAAEEVTTPPVIAAEEVSTVVTPKLWGAKSWRGSSISYSHATTAISANKGAEPNWNPYYLHRLAFRPQWNLAGKLTVRGSFDLGQELTLADDTTSRNEVVVSDATVDLGWTGWEDPWAKIRVAGGLRLGAGLSKVSRAQTKFLTVGPGVSVARSFGVLSGLQLRYDVRYTERLHRSTTTLYQAPTLSFCDGRELSECAQYAHSGTRNAARDVSQGVGISFSPHPRVSLSSGLQTSHAFLYPLTPVQQSHPLPDDEGVSVRYAWGFSLGASVKVLPELSVSLGSSTFAAQLRPDGQRRAPFFNRFTNLYLDLGIDLESLLARL